MISQLVNSIELGEVPVSKPTGRLASASGMLLEVRGCEMHIGQRCRIEIAAGGWLHAQVVGFRDEKYLVMPFKKTEGLRADARVHPIHGDSEVLIGPSWLGRVVNGLGEPIDGLGRLGGEHRISSTPPRVDPLRKAPVEEPLDVGVRAINGLLTLGRGQRVGLMAGSGVGKSVLLGLITRQTVADVVVVGLIGERSREVREFIDLSLGAAGLARSVVVVAPADESPLMRLRATELCHSVAAHYRDQGLNVLLLVDSLTRYAMAQREVALSLGEPPATRGYPPSVFSALPQLVESAGNGEHGGSMSAIYTVLAEGDDQQDPVVDTARAILDGHIVLSRALAETGHFPAIDIEQSASRVMHNVVAREHFDLARRFRAVYSRYQKSRDLVQVGAYMSGSDPALDEAIRLQPQMAAYLQQDMFEAASLDDSVAHMAAVLDH